MLFSWDFYNIFYHPRHPEIQKAHIWNQTGCCSFDTINLAFRMVNSSIPSKITDKLARNSQIPSQAITRI
jgi:hypothetical protein